MTEINNLQCLNAFVVATFRDIHGARVFQLYIYMCYYTAMIFTYPLEDHKHFPRLGLALFIKPARDYEFSEERRRKDNIVNYWRSVFSFRECFARVAALIFVRINPNTFTTAIYFLHKQ